MSVAHSNILRRLQSSIRQGRRAVRSSRLMILALILLSGCAYAIVHDGTVNQTQADRVVAGIQRERGLEFVQSVPLVVKTRDQAETILRAEMKRDHTEDELRLGGQSGAMAGLYPPGMDLEVETVKLLRSQIAGFYDPYTQQMVLVQGAVDLGFWNSAAQFMTRRDIVDEMLLAHELTHALQDQHFQIEQMLRAVEDDDDRSLALKAVVEGDATLAGFGYVAGGLDDATVNRAVTRLSQLPATFARQSGEVPLGLRAPMVFQYAAGTAFVAKAFEQGGWAAVDALYHRPPESTLEIIEPELYYDDHFLPAKIAIDGYQAILPDWQKKDDDTYGALLIKTILQRTLGADAPALGVVDDWIGDRMLVFERGQELTLVWLVAFRDERSAATFATAYGTVLERIAGPATPFRVAAHNAAVLAVIGVGARQFSTLAPAIWQNSTINRELATPETATPPATPVTHLQAASVSASRTGL